MKLEELQKVFESFRDQCFWLNADRNTFYILHKNQDILWQTASQFFHDVNRMFLENYILQVCKLTDPAKTRKSSNLTAPFINHELETLNLITDEIKTLLEKLLQYRALIEDARNKLVSHSDLEAVMQQVCLGAHAKQDIDVFFDNLFRYNDAVAAALGISRCDISGTSASGDAYDLIKVLRRGLAARRT